MLGTTILLYAIATQLFDRMSAYIAIGLWSVCEPCLKLGAFATYDPMSVFVICLGAWVAIQAGQRRHHGEFVALAGPILALGSVIGYSYAIYHPIEIAVAGLAWAPWLGRRQAAISAAWLTGAIGVPLLAALTFLKLWPGIFFTVLSRHVTIAQGYKLVVSNAWSWQGIVTCLAIVGVVMAVAQRKHVALACVLAATSLLVPLDQARLQTGVSLDKHLSVGAWFAAMAAGYGVCQIVKAHRPTKALATAGCIVFAIPAVTGVSAAQWTFHGWSNASALTSAFMKYAARVRGNYAIVNLNENVLRFATPEGNHWRRWTGLPSASVVGGSGPRQRMLTAQYEVLLHRHKLGIVVVSFSTPSPTSLAQTAVRGAAGAIRGTLLDQEVLRLISGPGTPGMTAAIEALVTNRNYVPVAVVPYGPDSSCVIWLLRGTSQ
jgi:hypothetical protein